MLILFCFCKASAAVLTLRLHIMICMTEERTSTCMMKNKINNSTLFTKMSLILDESVADDMIRMTDDECYCSYCMLSTLPGYFKPRRTSS